VKLPIHPHLLILRSATTVTLSALISQAGWASAMLGRDPSYLRMHSIGAWVALFSCWAAAGIYTVLRATAGRVLTVLAWSQAVLASFQFLVGRASVVDVHIFSGILLAMLGTALTSWTYRHPAPEG